VTFLCPSAKFLQIIASRFTALMAEAPTSRIWNRPKKITPTTPEDEQDKIEEDRDQDARSEKIQEIINTSITPWLTFKDPRDEILFIRRMKHHNRPIHWPLGWLYVCSMLVVEGYLLSDVLAESHAFVIAALVFMTASTVFILILIIAQSLSQRDNLITRISDKSERISPLGYRTCNSIASSKCVTQTLLVLLKVVAGILIFFCCRHRRRMLRQPWSWQQALSNRALVLLRSQYQYGTSLCPPAIVQSAFYSFLDASFHSVCYLRR
jgi:hypothetical protein